MPGRQLNIRSDEAAERAARLAKALGKSATQVVEDALRVYEEHACPPDDLGLTPSGRKRYDAAMRVIDQVRSQVPPDADWDETWMYDEHGLPR